MQSYITNIRLSGIKNIDKEINLDFYKKTITKKFTLNQSNIKAIYGENGVGKTGIIHAMDIYKKINMERNYLLDSKTYDVLEELINKATHSLSIMVTFLSIYDENVFFEISHEVCIKKENDHYIIEKEAIYDHKALKGNTQKKEALICIENGEFLPASLVVSDELQKSTANLLKGRSLLNVFRYEVLNRELQTAIDKFGERFTLIALQAILMNTNLRVILNDTDSHDFFRDINQTFMVDTLKKNKLSMKLPNNEEQHILLSKQMNCINTLADVIKIEDKSNYLQQIERMSKFLKLFKSDLKGIEVDLKQDKNYLICEKYFAYEEYRINIEFESTGMKKLVQLFSAFEQFVNGSIIFIDEFDANIHDVYLSALLEYFTYYAKGQLCFTTHNLGPMEVLRKQKFSIDFLSKDHKITSWKKRGNYSVVNLYREGMIENSPFNIEPFDFLTIFNANE